MNASSPSASTEPLRRGRGTENPSPHPKSTSYARWSSRATSFPGWDFFGGADAADLDQQARDRFTSAAVPVPEAVARGVVRLTDERRFDVPRCGCLSRVHPAQAEEWITAGESPELARATHLEYVDLDSGHWPMATHPRELAPVVAKAANS